jgi:hypothetical protein
MSRRDVTLTDIIALHKKLKTNYVLESSSASGNNWSAEIYNCIRYAAARETANSMDITPQQQGFSEK